MTTKQTVFRSGDCWLAQTADYSISLVTFPHSSAFPKYMSTALFSSGSPNTSDASDLILLNSTHELQYLSHVNIWIVSKSWQIGEWKCSHNKVSYMHSVIEDLLKVMATFTSLTWCNHKLKELLFTSEGAIVEKHIHLITTVCCPADKNSIPHSPADRADIKSLRCPVLWACFLLGVCFIGGLTLITGSNRVESSECCTVRWHTDYD